MQVLVLVDPEFAERETTILERLEIGLVDDGWRVTQMIPGRGDLPLDHGVYAQVLAGPPKLWFRRSAGQAAWIAKRLDADSQPDLIHVLGERCWPLGSALARLLDCPLAIELWSKSSVELAARSHDAGAGFLAADRALFDLADALGLGSRTRLAPWGVRAQGEPSKIFRAGVTPSLLLLGTGRAPEVVRSTLRQIGVAVADRPDVEVFVDAQSGSARDAWSTARAAGLQDRLSIIDKIERAAELVLHADMLVYPESFGEQRSLLLEAMGRGLAVVAAQDDANALISAERCVAVDPDDSDGIAGAIDRLLASPSEARELGRAAWHHVKTERRASSHVTAVLDAYEWLVGKASLPFSDA